MFISFSILMGEGVSAFRPHSFYPVTIRGSLLHEGTSSTPTSWTWAKPFYSWPPWSNLGAGVLDVPKESAVSPSIPFARVQSLLSKPLIQPAMDKCSRTNLHGKYHLIEDALISDPRNISNDQAYAPEPVFIWISLLGDPSILHGAKKSQVHMDTFRD